MLLVGLALLLLPFWSSQQPSGTIPPEESYSWCGGVNDLAFSHDGSRLAVANGNTTVYILRIDSLRK